MAGLQVVNENCSVWEFRQNSFLSPDWKHILYLKELILRQKVVFTVHVVADAVDDDADANVELDDDDAVWRRFKMQQKHPNFLNKEWK